jgi:hypothetical protein
MNYLLVYKKNFLGELDKNLYCVDEYRTSRFQKDKREGFSATVSNIEALAKNIDTN